MGASLIPLQSNNQTLSVYLGTVQYNLYVHWCAPANCWIVDISDANNNPLVGGIPLITGADLLAQYEYLGFDVALIVQTANDALAVPTYQNLGTSGNLYAVQ